MARQTIVGYIAGSIRRRAVRPKAGGFSVFLALLLAAGGVAAAEIGQLIGVVPGVFAAREGKTVPLVLHSPVEASDIIHTDAAGRARILFNDDSTVALGGNTSLEMRDFADSGAQPVFDVHLLQGVARIVTGRVVEMNPSGFKVTTPEAHVGIRGTILSLRTMNGITTVYVENTTREVYVNDLRIPGGQKITLPGDPLRTEPIQPEDRRGLGRDLALLGGRGAAAAAPEPEMSVRLPGETPLAYASADGASPPATPLKALPLTPNLSGGSLIPPVSSPVTPPPNVGYVVGTLISTTGVGVSWPYADFAFSVDLGTGAIFDAEMHGLLVNAYGGSEQFDAVGGSGTLSGGTTVIGGFTGHAISYTPGSAAYVPPIAPADPTTLTFTSGTPGVLGSPVAGTYYADSSGWSPVDSGTLAGTWQAMPPMPTTGFVSGTLATGDIVTPGADFAGTFSFYVDLSSGVISGGTMSGSATVAFDTLSSTAAPLNVNFTGGIGSVSGNTYLVEFSSAGAVTGDFNSAPLDPTTLLYSLMKGSVDPTIVHSGGMVPVDYIIGHYSTMYQYDSGFGIGTITKY